MLPHILHLVLACVVSYLEVHPELATLVILREFIVEFHIEVCDAVSIDLVEQVAQVEVLLDVLVIAHVYDVQRIRYHVRILVLVVEVCE